MRQRRRARKSNTGKEILQYVLNPFNKHSILFQLMLLWWGGGGIRLSPLSLFILYSLSIKESRIEIKILPYIFVSFPTNLIL